jgi:energy-coupling factor transporter ATP-binding protein EcfA2
MNNLPIIFNKEYINAKDLVICGENYKINFFNLNKIKENSLIIIIGMSGCGKTQLINKILSKFSHTNIENSLVVTNNIDYYDENYPESTNMINYNSSILDNKLDTDGGFIVLDECINRDDINSSTMYDFFTSSNKIRILSLQSPPNVTRFLNYNIDYIFIFKERFNAIQRRIFVNYCNILPSLSDFKYILECLTNNYNCMVIDNKSTPSITNRIFWYNSRI